MSRVWAEEHKREGLKPPWRMVCDRLGCSTRTEPRPTENDLPLEEFAQAGWFIASVHGDRCPECVEAAGGLYVVAELARTKGGPGEPHQLTLDYLDRSFGPQGGAS